MKKYFISKENRYGYENKVKTKIGNIPFVFLYLAKRTLACFLILALFTFVMCFWNVLASYLLTFVATIFILSYLAITFIKIAFISCRYASKDRDKVQCYFDGKVAKHKKFAEEYKIVEEDNWFMVMDINYISKSKKNKE